MSSLPRFRIEGDVDRLMVVLDDQLDARAPALDVLDPIRDAVLMVEVAESWEARPCHRQRAVLRISAARHFALHLAARGLRVHYVRLDDDNNTQTLRGEVARAARQLRARRMLATRPGTWRALDDLHTVARGTGLPLEVLPDAHFLTDLEHFAQWAHGARLSPESFYRHQRQRLGLLMEADGSPTTGSWTPAVGCTRPSPQQPPDPPWSPKPDAVTADVCALVAARLPGLSGALDIRSLRWPVTADEAEQALQHFVDRRLAGFAALRDTIRADDPFVCHSLLSAPLNLKLLSPRRCVEAAMDALHREQAGVADVEAFLRPIIGLREFVRGVYWTQGRSYRDHNGLGQYGSLPAWYTNAATDMHCLANAIAAVLQHGYAHDAVRRHVLVNFATIAGVHPANVIAWFSGMLVDGADWMAVPSVLGLSMRADRGVVSARPCAAPGSEIAARSDLCASCRYDPTQDEGSRACPLNVLYTDFLHRARQHIGHEPLLAGAWRTLDAWPHERIEAIVRQARRMRSELGIDVSTGVSDARTGE